jgi:hypothetical protein
LIISFISKEQVSMSSTFEFDIPNLSVSEMPIFSIEEITSFSGPYWRPQVSSPITSFSKGGVLTAILLKHLANLYILHGFLQRVKESTVPI